VVSAIFFSGDLLTELWAEFEAARERPQTQSCADAVLHISLGLKMPLEKVEAGLAALEAQRRVSRKVLLPWIAETWLKRQRQMYRRAAQECEPPSSEGGTNGWRE
jgi:hypothetical protein